MLETLKNDKHKFGDKPVLKLSVKNKFEKMDDLSLGQKAVAAMLLLLKQDDFGPFIIDEPEQHLDNESVFDYLVPRLKQLKGKQQVILVTRTPNIPVAGDAENILIVARKSTNRSVISYQGALDKSKLKEEVMDILEGGEEAFMSRGLKYDLLDKN